jgi:hypothetical protein
MTHATLQLLVRHVNVFAADTPRGYRKEEEF